MGGQQPGVGECLAGREAGGRAGREERRHQAGRLPAAVAQLPLAVAARQETQDSAAAGPGLQQSELRDGTGRGGTSPGRGSGRPPGERTAWRQPPTCRQAAPPPHRHRACKHNNWFQFHLSGAHNLRREKLQRAGQAPRLPLHLVRLSRQAELRQLAPAIRALAGQLNCLSPLKVVTCFASLML